MIDYRALVDNIEILRHIIESTKVLLLDFDGPICSVFSRMPAQTVAQQLRNTIKTRGHTDLPPEIEKTDDPFTIFSYSATISRNESHHIEAVLRAHEVEAAMTAEPTLDAHNLIRAWHNSGRELAIVSNNSTTAVMSYLDRFDLAQYVTTVSARTGSDPRLLKPAPYLLRKVMDLSTVTSDRFTLIGDSITDLQAARTSGAKSIGYANRQHKIDLMENFHANSIVTRLGDIVSIVQD